MKTVCVLLDMSIWNDARVERSVKSMSQYSKVDLFCLRLKKDDTEKFSRFNENVRVFPIQKQESKKITLIRHSYFHKEYSYFINEVLKTGITYDLIFANDLTTTYPAFVLAKKMNAKFIYDTHELFVETLNQLFPTKARGIKKIIYSAMVSFLRSVGRKWEKKVLQTTDLLVTTNETYLKYLREHYQFGDSVIMPNYPLLASYSYSEKLYEVLNIPKSKKIILYQGVLNEGRYLYEIIDSARFLNNENILVIIGSGQLAPLLHQHVEKYNLQEKVKFIPRVDYKDLLSYTPSASLGLMLIEHINLSKKYSLANKVTEYMACGVPVLASESTENIRIISQAKSGVTKSFNTGEEIGNYLNELMKNSEQLKQWGRNGREAFEKEFNWEKHEPIFFAAFKKVLEAK